MGPRDSTTLGLQPHHLQDLLKCAITENGLENFISALESTMAMGVTTDAKLEDIRLGHKNLESPDTNRAGRSKRSRGEL